jgi:hypothetical protein
VLADLLGFRLASRKAPRIRVVDRWLVFATIVREAAHVSFF